jgi:hypothetical protein
MKTKMFFFVFCVACLLLCDSAARATDFTHEAASLSIGRHGFGATTVGDLALFAGGAFRQTPSSPLELTDVVDIYDTAANAWTTDALSQRRRYVSAASVGSLALFGGGYAYDPDTDTAFYTTAVDLYDSVSRTWTTAALSQPRANLAAVTAGDFALFGGGFWYDEGYVYSNVVDVFNATDGTWTATTLPTAAGSDITALAAGGLALFADGDTVDVYDPVAGSWTTTSVPGDRLGIGEAAGDKAVFIGEDGAAVFDATTREWTFTDEPAAPTGTPLWTGTLQSSAAVGETIVFGGIGRCVTYDTAAGEWGNPDPDGSSLTYAGAATSLDGKVLFDSQWIWEPQDPPPSTQLDLVRAAWGSCGPEGDLNGDGYVGSADLDIVRANWVVPWYQQPARGLTVFDPETGEWTYGPGAVGFGRRIGLSAGDTALFAYDEDRIVDLYIAGGSAVPEPGTALGLVSLLLAVLCARRRW